MKIEQVKADLSQLLSSSVPFTSQQVYSKMLSFVDLTTLDGTDTDQKVEQLCRKAMDYHTAAVCVYPYFASQVSRLLYQTGIKTACVAGGFPASQLPLEVKLYEVEQTLSDGADEIDMVISQGAFLEGDYKRVGAEVRAFKDLCGKRCLKVILETGNLQTPDNIELASCISIDNGADFIKTSTGKTPVSATPEAFYVMLRVIERYASQGHVVGIKPAGGISTLDEAVNYFKLVYLILGDKWIDPSLFRVGTSRLADALYKASI